MGYIISYVYQVYYESQHLEHSRFKFSHWVDTFIWSDLQIILKHTRSNLGFYVLTKDTSTCGLEELGFKSSTTINNLLYLLSHSVYVFS